MEGLEAGTVEWLMHCMRRRQQRRVAVAVQSERDRLMSRSAAIGREIRPGQGGPGVPRPRTAAPTPRYPNKEGWEMWQRDPMKAPWRDYVGDLPVGSLLRKEFREKFRVPKEIFDKWLRLTKTSGKFRFPGDGIKGQQPKPLENSLMCVFRVLGIGCPFDALEEASGMDAETIRRFFHKWLAWAVNNHYKQFVKLATTYDEIERNEKVFNKLGLPGAVYSMDGVHCAADNVAHRYRHRYIGKEGYPTVAWNVLSSHSKKIAHVSCMFMGSKNDKTMVRRDDGVLAVKNDSLFTEYHFWIYDMDGNKIGHRGVWIVCDGGYHEWRATICAMKIPPNEAASRWARTMGSVRKDIECVFGILKRRFRILRLPMLYGDDEKMDNVFRVCCMLHNQLLDFDGLEGIGQEEEHYLESGACMADISQAEDDAADAIARRRAQAGLAPLPGNRANGTRVVQWDGYQNGVTLTPSTDMCFLTAPTPPEDTVIENEAGFKEFREALIGHYTYMASKNLIRWCKTAKAIRDA